MQLELSKVEIYFFWWRNTLSETEFRSVGTLVNQKSLSHHILTVLQGVQISATVEANMCATKMFLTDKYFNSQY